MSESKNCWHWKIYIGQYVDHIWRNCLNISVLYIFPFLTHVKSNTVFHTVGFFDKLDTWYCIQYSFYTKLRNIIGMPHVYRSACCKCNCLIRLHNYHDLRMQLNKSFFSYYYSITFQSKKTIFNGKNAVILNENRFVRKVNFYNLK